jgi:rare lipoprotein A
VVNLDNDTHVDVRIIDRGPFVNGRIIDLSHAAAAAIGMLGPGTAHVRVDVLQLPQNASLSAGTFAVQVGAFRDRGNAERFRTQMESRYGSARIVLREGDPSFWRVLVGHENTETEARTLSEKIRSEIGERNAFVVRLDS